MICQPDFSATISDRNTGAPIADLDPFVAAWSKHVYGGDRRALIDLCDYDQDLEPLLGAQTTLHADSTTEPCWCGYIAYLRRCCSDGLCCGYVAWGLTLDNMWNRIAVAYTHGNASLVTDFAEDAASIAAYGIKEVIVPLPTDSLLTPTQYRDRLLDAVSGPQPILYTGSKCECDITYVVARGWWETLGWQLYKNECGAANSGASGSTAIPLGLGFTSDLVGIDERGEINYLSVLGDQLAAFPVGEQILISGTANPANSVITTLTRRLRADNIHGVTDNTITFDPADDIEDAGNRFAIFQNGEMVRVSGSNDNDGFHFVKRVLADGSRIEVTSGGGIVAEAAGNTVTVEAGTTVVVDTFIDNELPGAAITVISLAQAICQQVCNPCAETWTCNHIQLAVRRVGNPTGDLQVDLCTCTGTQCGAVLDTATLPANQVADQFASLDVLFTTGAPIAAGGCLCVRIHNPSGPSTTDYYELGVDTNPTLTPATISPDGLTWFPPSQPYTLAVQLYADVELATQAAAMGQHWQFVNNVIVNTPVDFRVPVYRDGRHSIRYELERLIQLGSPDGRRLRITLDCDRNLIIDVEPAREDGCLTLDCDGVLLDPDGNAIDICTAQAGVWICPEPGAADVESAFLESFEVNAKTCRFTYTARTVNFTDLGVVFSYGGILG